MRCPHGEIVRPFGEGGGDLVAAELGVPLLGRVPLGGAFKPGTGLFAADSDSQRVFADIATTVRGRDRPLVPIGATSL